MIRALLKKWKRKDCSGKLEELQKISATLKTFKTQPLPSGYTHELHYKLVNAARERELTPHWKSQIRFIFPKLKYAVFALALAVFLPGAYHFYKNQIFNKTEIKSETFNVLNLDQQGTVKFRINTAKKIDEAVFRINLSNGLCFLKNGAADCAQKEIVWRGSLDKGENIIVVYVIGSRKGSWLVTAKMEEDSNMKEIKVPFSVL